MELGGILPLQERQVILASLVILDSQEYPVILVSQAFLVILVYLDFLVILVSPVIVVFQV